MTHEEAIAKYEIALNAPYCHDGYAELAKQVSIAAIIAPWKAKNRIPLIHIPNVAKAIGVKPSDIDPYFIGKDDLTIQWESKDER